LSQRHRAYHRLDDCQRPHRAPSRCAAGVQPRRRDPAILSAPAAACLERTLERRAAGRFRTPNPFRQSLPRSPVDYARGLFYDTLLFDARAIRYLVDMVGISQVTVGTDYPFVPREQPVAATLKSMGLSPDEWDQVSWRNCLRFLGLSGEAT